MLYRFKGFSSLYIGILAATRGILAVLRLLFRFSSLYIGILAATRRDFTKRYFGLLFQFPLHRDPRCNVFCLGVWYERE